MSRTRPAPTIGPAPPAGLAAFRCAGVCAACLLAAPAASAQVYGRPLVQSAPIPQAAAPAASDEWALKMFAERSHDFGVVARGAAVKHRIEIKNPYEQTVHVSSVGTSCGCSAGSIEERTIEPGESTFVEVSMDTKRFTRNKDSNVIVRFDAPRPAEVRIPVKMYVRTDVVLTPGEVNFGAVDKAAGATRTVDVAYAGRDTWTIRGVEGLEDSGVLSAEIEELTRTPGGGNLTGQVRYRLSVTLDPSAKVGPVRERLVLVTDDATNPYVPVLVEGTVEDDINVRDLDFGLLTPGQSKTMNVVLRGREPFGIDGIACAGDRECFEVRLPKNERTVHVLPLTFTAPAEPGRFRDEIRVSVPGRDDPVTFAATARIVGT